MLLKWPGQATHPDFCGCQCRGARWPPVGPYKAEHLQPADHFSHHARPTSPPPLSGTVSQPCHGNTFIESLHSAIVTCRLLNSLHFTHYPQFIVPYMALKSWTLSSARCRLHTVRCRLHTVRCRLHTVRCMLHTVRCTLHGSLCMICTFGCLGSASPSSTLYKQGCGARRQGEAKMQHITSQLTQT